MKPTHTRTRAHARKGFFSADFSTASASRVVPAFPAVYGGYVYSAGAEFFADDLTNGDGDVFAARLAQQLRFGAQLGWMSLGRGRQDPSMGEWRLHRRSRTVRWGVVGSFTHGTSTHNARRDRSVWLLVGVQGSTTR